MIGSFVRSGCIKKGTEFSKAIGDSYKGEYLLKGEGYLGKVGRVRVVLFFFSFPFQATVYKALLRFPLFSKRCLRPVQREVGLGRTASEIMCFMGHCVLSSCFAFCSGLGEPHLLYGELFPGEGRTLASIST